MQLQDKKRVKEIWSFLGVLFLFAVITFLRYFEHIINEQDTTVFAFSYRYGFISRGFMGSVWAVLDKLLPWNLMSYRGIYLLSFAANMVFFLLLFSFFAVCLYRSSKIDFIKMKYLIFFVSIFSFSFFWTKENYGRLDIYLTIIMLLCMILLLTEKAPWLVIPLCIIGVLIHQGFVFSNLNIVLVMLFIKCLTKEKRERIKYWVILLATGISSSVLFLYFELFRHLAGTKDIYQEIWNRAAALSYDGKSVSKFIMRHEVLGENMYQFERGFHILNYQQLPFFLLFFLPYFVIAFFFFRNLYRKSEGKVAKWCTLVVILGAATVLPEYVLKIDYGRYFYMIIFYYITIVMCLLADHNEAVSEEITHLVIVVKKHLPAAGFLLVYPLLFMPFGDVEMTDVIQNLFRLIGLEN